MIRVFSVDSRLPVLIRVYQQKSAVMFFGQLLNAAC